MKNENLFKVLILIILFISCSNQDMENTKNNIKNPKDIENIDTGDLPTSGSYSWSFKIVLSEQKSTHTFFSDRIDYKMEGGIYSTKYSMKKISYEKDKGKWIGKDEKGNVYVMFFKDKTENSVTIYKHKCKKGGLKEAEDFEKPSADTTDDHGWNVYTLNGGSTNDEKLNISGEFSNKKGKIYISDDYVKIGNKKFGKISFHSGERRWVGQLLGTLKNEYVLIFFKDLENDNLIQISVTLFTDLKKLYKTKYNSVTNWEDYDRQ